jgi:hypothetical protein
MESKKHLYMTISMDMLNNGFNFCCWFSPARFWLEETAMFPNDYTREEVEHIWHIHANHELTNKVISMAVETAGDIIAQQAAVNSRRKLANR